MEDLAAYAEHVGNKIGPYKDVQGGDLDPQWCTLGGLYLQYLHSYDPTNGMTQLENFSKFFSYSLVLTCVDVDYLRCYSYVLQDHGQFR